MQPDVLIVESAPFYAAHVADGRLSATRCIVESTRRSGRGRAEEARARMFAHLTDAKQLSIRSNDAVFRPA